jgi:hypothetical protein
VGQVSGDIDWQEWAGVTLMCFEHVVNVLSMHFFRRSLSTGFWRPSGLVCWSGGIAVGVRGSSVRLACVVFTLLSGCGAVSAWMLVTAKQGQHQAKQAQHPRKQEQHQLSRSNIHTGRAEIRTEPDPYCNTPPKMSLLLRYLDTHIRNVPPAMSGRKFRKREDKSNVSGSAEICSSWSGTQSLASSAQVGLALALAHAIL